MGYRSEVVVAIGFPDDDAMVAFVTERKLSGAINEEELGHYNVMRGSGHDGVATDTDPYGVVTNTDGIRMVEYRPTILYVHFDHAKWYEGYEDVQMHMSMIEKAKLLGLPTYFARVGEDIGDIVCEYFEEAWTDEDAQLRYAETNVDWLGSGFEAVSYLGVPRDNDQWTIKEAIKRRETDEQPRETIESQDAVSS